MTGNLVATVLRLGLIGLLTFLGVWALRPFARRIEIRLEKTTADLERLWRLKTLLSAGRGVASVLLLLIGGLSALHVVGIDITPLLASAGIVGLALSLGAQTLVKDYLAGIIVLVEDQYRVGDAIAVGDQSGTVEKIGLRSTRLRDADGRLHVIPNGEIRIVSNLTRDWARAIVDLNVAFDADFGQVMRALESAALRASEDPAIKTDLLEPPQAVGWIAFKDWAVQVRLTAKTAPGKQWGVAMALRKYAVEALKAEGARVAVPTQEVRLERGE